MARKTYDNKKRELEKTKFNARINEIISEPSVKVRTKKLEELAADVTLYLKKNTDKIDEEIAKGTEVDDERVRFLQDDNLEVMNNIIEIYYKNFGHIPEKFEKMAGDVAKGLVDSGYFEEGLAMYDKFVGAYEKELEQIESLNQSEKLIENITERNYHFKILEDYYILKYRMSMISLDDVEKKLSRIGIQEGKDVIKGKYPQVRIFENVFSNIVSANGLMQLLTNIQPTNTQRNNQGNGTSKPVVYGTVISPVNRLTYILDHFDVAQIRQSQGDFADYMVFVLNGTDTVIVEKFFERDKNNRKDKDGNAIVYEAKEEATYICKREDVISVLANYSKSQVRSLPNTEVANHISNIDKKLGVGRYYINLIDKVNKVNGAPISLKMPKEQTRAGDPQVPPKQPKAPAKKTKATPITGSRPKQQPAAPKKSKVKKAQATTTKTDAPKADKTKVKATPKTDTTKVKAAPKAPVDPVKASLTDEVLDAMAALEDVNNKIIEARKLKQDVTSLYEEQSRLAAELMKKMKGLDEK